MVLAAVVAAILGFIMAERLKREREARPEPEFSVAAGE